METNFQPTRRKPNIGRILLVAFLIAGIAYFGYQSFAGKGSKPSDDNTEQAADNQNTNGGGEDGGNAQPLVYESNAINVGICTWAGYGTAVEYNNGMIANDESRFTRDHGIRVNFNVMDEFDITRSALMSNQIDMVWATVDAFSSEAQDLSKAPNYIKIAFPTDCSDGGDVVVVREGINSVEDLRGKTIAFAALSPSHSLLINLLEAGGMTLADVNAVETNSPLAATTAFTSNQVDAAVVWAPDDKTCLKDVRGSKVLASTKTTSNLIYNVFLAKRDYLASHHDQVVKLFEGWMTANAELKSDPSASGRVARALVSHMGWSSEKDAQAAMDNVKFLTIGDVINLVGMNADYRGATASDIYTRFGALYKDAGKIERTPPSWNSVFDKSIVTDVVALLGNTDKGEGRREFTPASKEVATRSAIASKPVTINFSTGQFKLDNAAMNTIDREFGFIIKTNRDARIRVIGNTDNVGDARKNKELSFKRANAVRDYLVERYDSDPNRFIIIGNGPQAAIDAGVMGESREYRRTDFELVQD